MTKKINIHPQLHDVFGEQQSLIELLLIILFGLSVPAVLYYLNADYLNNIATWKIVVAMVFIADIAAGCVANFTKSTNNFYATRAKHRWIFIGIHFHILIVAFGLETDLYNAGIIWVYTMVGASIVNLSKGSTAHVFVGGFILSFGLTLSLLLPNVHPIMTIIQALFMLKVIFSFSVDHYVNSKR